MTDTNNTSEPEEDETVPSGVAGVVETPEDIEARARRRGQRRGVSGPGPAGRRRALLIAAAVAGVVLLVALGDLAVSWGRIHPGVKIGEVAVGAMSPAQARGAITDAFARTSKDPVVVQWGEKDFKITAKSIDARMDATASVEAALSVGRDGGVLKAVGDRFAAAFGGVEVTAVVDVDEQATTAELDRVDASAAQAARDATVSVSGTDVTMGRSHDGRALDRKVTSAAILAALASVRRTIPATVATVTASISDADAEAARKQAVALIAGPVTITFEKDSLPVARGTVARWVVFSRETSLAAGEPTSAVVVTLNASFDATRLAPAIASLGAGRTRAPKDAAFVTEGGKVRITASQVGSGPDFATLASDLARACLGSGERTAELRLTVTQPSLTTDAAKAMGIVERISTYTTSYATVNPARTNNVHLLAKTFDGDLVKPGGLFSFNGYAGQRTAAKGYQEAPAIVKGKLVPQLGGGVCQVGTTFFNTVFFSGLPITERHNHSFYISHYPKGRDATVSWGGPDFKFRNETSTWILVRTSVTASTLTISLYGTNPGYDVKYTTGAFTDVVPHKTQEVPDPTRKLGKRFVEDAGVDGCSVVVVRSVFDKAGLLVRKDTFVSHYNPKIEVVRVGTKVSTIPTPTATP